MKKIETKKLNLFYGNFHALIDVDLAIEEKMITALIGPSGCGKSTLLRTFNRMNDLIDGVRITGEALIDGENIYGSRRDLIALRKKVGMVFQRPNPFPLSIFDNVAYGPRTHGLHHKSELEAIVQKALSDVMLWDVLKDRLDRSALNLSLEQQQRLCIARTLAVEPEVILYDEPCSGLDPISTAKVEDAMRELKSRYTQILVTNNVKQAARVGDRVAFFLMGELVEIDETDRIFTAPADKRTNDYLTGKFG
jgi:phosphate transport system ATP-binding protein